MPFVWILGIRRSEVLGLRLLHTRRAVGNGRHMTNATSHTHRFRVDEKPIEGKYHGQCFDCGARKDFPANPGYDFNVKRSASINGIPYFMLPFAWGSDGLVKGQRDRNNTRKDHDPDDDSE